MRILHILDHSIPLHSGYTFRTAAILREQRALGWETFHLTSPKQGHCAAAHEEVDGLDFYRCPVPPAGPAGLNEWRLIRATEQRLEALVRELKPDVIHAHSPVLNAIPAIRVGRRLGVPVVYEIRAFWEDAAVDHGTTAEGSLRTLRTAGVAPDLIVGDFDSLGYVPKCRRVSRHPVKKDKSDMEPDCLLIGIRIKATSRNDATRGCNAQHVGHVPFEATQVVVTQHMRVQSCNCQVLFISGKRLNTYHTRVDDADDDVLAK